MDAKTYALLNRWMLNVWPCIWSTGGRVTYLKEDFTQLTVELKLGLRTRNIVGTVFGGSLYGSTDPFFMLMLMRILGKDYVVWDKGCTIRFKRPAKDTVRADFVITPQMLADVRAQVAQKGEAQVTWTVAHKGTDGTVYAEFDKVMYVADKAFYENKLRARAAKAQDALINSTTG